MALSYLRIWSYEEFGLEKVCETWKHFFFMKSPFFQFGKRNEELRVNSKNSQNTQKNEEKTFKLRQKRKAPQNTKFLSFLLHKLFFFAPLFVFMFVRSFIFSFTRITLQVKQYYWVEIIFISFSRTKRIFSAEKLVILLANVGESFE